LASGGTRFGSVEIASRTATAGTAVTLSLLRGCVQPACSRNEQSVVRVDRVSQAARPALHDRQTPRSVVTGQGCA